MPESIRNMITPPRNSAPRVQDDEPAASRTPVQAAAPVVDENSIRAQVLAEQKARVLVVQVWRCLPRSTTSRSITMARTGR